MDPTCSNTLSQFRLRDDTLTGGLRIRLLLKAVGLTEASEASAARVDSVLFVFSSETTMPWGPRQEVVSCNSLKCIL